MKKSLRKDYYKILDVGKVNGSLQKNPQEKPPCDGLVTGGLVSDRLDQVSKIASHLATDILVCGSTRPPHLQSLRKL